MTNISLVNEDHGVLWVRHAPALVVHPPEAGVVLIPDELPHLEAQHDLQVSLPLTGLTFSPYLNSVVRPTPKYSCTVIGSPPWSITSCT